MVFYVRKINDKFKNHDGILRDLIHSTSSLMGNNEDHSKYDSILNETILESKNEGRLRFEDLIDVPDDYLQDEEVYDQINENLSKDSKKEATLDLMKEQT